MTDQALRLLADGMLGKLAKWLRLLGYDTAYENNASDPELARRARAEDRVLLTRDHDLANRRGLRTLLIESEVLEKQVQEVKDALGSAPASPFSRCAVCNTALEPISPAQITNRVPPYVLKTQTEFHHCPGCDRIYWAGTHIQRIRKQMEDFNADEPDKPKGA